jgi:hypothetical protein
LPQSTSTAATAHQQDLTVEGNTAKLEPHLHWEVLSVVQLQARTASEEMVMREEEAVGVEWDMEAIITWMPVRLSIAVWPSETGRRTVWEMDVVVLRQLAPEEVVAERLRLLFLSKDSMLFRHLQVLKPEVGVVEVVHEVPPEDEVRQEPVVVLPRCSHLRNIALRFSGFGLGILGAFTTYDHADDWTFFESSYVVWWKV